MLPFLISAANSTQPSIPPGQVNQVPACLAGVRRGVFTCIGWRVTLCDLIWQVTSCSSEMNSQEELYRLTSVIFSLITSYWADDSRMCIIHNSLIPDETATTFTSHESTPLLETISNTSFQHVCHGPN